MAIELTAEQKAVIEHVADRHARVLAGPGTGKSSTVISLANKLKQSGTEGVRLVTFTRAASGELAAKVLAEGTEGLKPSTIHSFAISILLSNPGSGGFPAPLRMLDEWEWKTLTRPLFCRQLHLTGQEWRLVDEFRKEMAAKWESLAENESLEITGPLRSRFLGAWDSQRALLGYSMVQEIPYRLHEALLSHPDLDLGGLRLLIVDEYQDLNACDLACLDHLAQRGVKLVAVGDDDQSIYSFRKAHPAGIRDFVTKYDAADYQLTMNHRCGRNILSWAESVIQRDLQRGTKAPVTPGQANADGEVAYLEFAGEVSEARGVANLIKRLNENRHVPYGDILVLARTSNVSDPIGKELEAQAIPFKYSDELSARLDDPAVRKSIAFLRLVANREDSLAWWSILHLTERVGVKSIDALLESSRSSDSRLGAHLLALTSENQLTSVAGRRIAEAVGSTLAALDRIEVPDEAQWGSWIRSQVEAGRVPAIPEDVIALLEQVDALSEATSLDRYVGQLRPMLKDLATTLKSDAVRVMTMASSKGLTSRACIIAGCEDNIIPHPLGRRDEEMRLLYVAMTRPQEYLFITRARTRKGTTARVGRVAVSERRTVCPFLEAGPVRQQDGDSFLASFK